MSLDTLLHRIDTYLRTARKRLPRLRRLPYLVVSPSWGDGDVVPHYQEWQAFERGESETTDRPGYERHNVEALEVAHQMRITPKVYGFDPDAELEVGVREALTRVEELAPPPAPTRQVYAEYTKRDGSVGRMEMREDI